MLKNLKSTSKDPPNRILAIVLLLLGFTILFSGIYFKITSYVYIGILINAFAALIYAQKFKFKLF